MYRVMIADDEPLVRTSLQVLVNWAEYDCEIVYIASDGQDVLSHIESTQPDIIITDIKMPGCGGIEVAKYVSENHLHIKVIILTGYVDFSYAKSALQYNVVDYVTKSGAFDGLEAAVKKAKEELAKEMELDVSENKLALEENFLKEILEGYESDPAEIAERAAALQIELCRYAVVLFQFSLDSTVDKHKNYKISKSLTQFFHMTLQERDCKIIPVRKNLFCILLNRLPASCRGEILQYCRETLDALQNFMKLKVTAGVSEPCESIGGLYEGYQHALDALDMGFLDSKQSVHFYTGQKIRTKTPKDAGVLTEKVSYCIQKGKTQEALETFRRLFELQRSGGLSAKSIKNTGLSFSNQCSRCLEELDISMQDVLGTNYDVEKEILQCLYAEDYLVLMEKILRASVEIISQYIQKSTALIYDCQQYIDQYYASNIMVADIAKKLSVSLSYLSRIYKEETGKTIIATINEKRVEKAKEYLAETNMKIYEVAEALGFVNTTYFSHFFKKHTNMSPKDFKDQMCQ